MTEGARRTAFNSPLETGVRSLSLLVAGYPASFDLQRLVELDYLVVHSGDAGGPESLHAPLPLRAGELLVRRGLIERGLMLMLSRRLADRLILKTGIEYRATDAAAPFFSLLEAGYTIELCKRAAWTVKQFGHLSSDDIRAVTRTFFERWSSEFQPPQPPSAIL